MTSNQLYDEIGQQYAQLRQTEPRIAAALHRALGQAETVLNVGAGTGSYEPVDKTVIAVEPSQTMIRQRATGTAPVVQASAVALPLDDATFDGGMAVLTMHHWSDRRLGLQELVRVVRGPIVIVTWDPDSSGFWLINDYFPEILDIDRPTFPTLDEFRQELGDIAVTVLPVPHDCIDGFLCAYWRRPHMYLDPHVRQAMSIFTKLRDVESRIARLQSDLKDGTWQRRYGELLPLTELDLGYRLVVRT